MRATSWAKLLRNASGQYLATAISVLTGLALVPFIVSHIGLASFSLWALVNGIFGTMGLLDAGLSPTLTKKSAELLAKNDQEKLKENASAILTLYLGVGFIAFLIICGLAIFARDLFHVPPDSIPAFRVVLLIVAAQLALSFPLSTWSGITAGLQDYHISAVIGVVINLLKFTLTLVLLRFGFGLISLIWLGFAANVFTGLGYVVWVKRRLPALRLRPTLRHLGQIGELTRFSGSMFIWGIAGRVVLESDRIIIGFFLPITAVGVYEIGLRICNYSRNVLYPVFTLLPAASDLSARNEAERLQKLYLVGTKYFLLLYAFVASGLFLFGRQFIHLWIGPGFDTSVVILFILLAGNIYQSQNVVAHVLLPGMGRLRAFTWIMASYPILNLTLSVIFIRRWGLVGVAAATAATYFIAETIFMYFISGIFRLRVSRIIWSCHVPVLAILTPAVLLTLKFKAFTPLPSWRGLITGLTVFSTCFGVAFLVYGLAGAEREQFRAAAAKLILRAA
jgi:O-antigen/teichoic acid export membrane protein